MPKERREVILTAGARNGLDDIVTYIAKDAPLSALAFLEEVLNTADDPAWTVLSLKNHQIARSPLVQ